MVRFAVGVGVVGCSVLSAGKLQLKLTLKLETQRKHELKVPVTMNFISSVLN